MVDDRIGRVPERIESALRNVFEVRGTSGGRRQAFARWREADGREQLASLILAGNRLLSMHLVDRQRVERYQRRGGEILWRL